MDDSETMSQDASREVDVRNDRRTVVGHGACSDKNHAPKRWIERHEWHSVSSGGVFRLLGKETATGWLATVFAG